MVEIRTFDGDMTELSEFCHGAWRRRCLGQTPYPIWTPEFLEWELSDSPATGEYQVAAYDGARLVGFLFIWSALAVYSAEGLWQTRRALQVRPL